MIVALKYLDYKLLFDINFKDKSKTIYNYEPIYYIHLNVP